MNILNPFSSQYNAITEVKHHYQNAYSVKANVIERNDRSRLSKAWVVAETIAIVVLSIALFPLGAAVFRTLVNRMTLQKVDITNQDGSKFKGTMKFGHYYQGKLSSSFDVLEGQWKLGVFQKGTKTLHDGTVLKGQFDKDRLNGKGEIISKNISPNQPRQFQLVHSKGSFVQGRLEGKGIEVFKNDKSTSVCQCQYKNGIRNGFGTRTDDGKLVYKGEWSEGNCHGKGTHYYSDGAVYTGEFVNNFREGQGEYKDPSGYTYKGAWNNNSQNGQGKSCTKDKKIYEGNFVNGMCRQGKVTTPDGKVYEGTWDEHGVFTAKGSY